MKLVLTANGSDDVYGETEVGSDGVLTFSTPDIAAVMKQMQGLTGLEGEALLATAEGWSNGYAQLVAAGDSPD